MARGSIYAMFTVITVTATWLYVEHRDVIRPANVHAYLEDFSVRHHDRWDGFDEKLDEILSQLDEVERELDSLRNDTGGE